MTDSAQDVIAEQELDGPPKKRRVLKTHRSNLKFQQDPDDEVITTESLKDILDISKLPQPSDDSTEKLEHDKNESNNKGKQSQEGPPPSEHEPTSTLYIKNFVRPLTLTAVRTLLEQFGTIEYFWMNKIKSHCYVKYETVDSAVKTRNEMWNVKWPPETGRLLILDFINYEQALESIQKEEANENSDRSQAIKSSSNGNQQSSQQNVSHLSLDKLFSKTTTIPVLYFKLVSREAAETRMQNMARKRERR
ncbi:13372_t:CDS:2 [Ambispora gerdemannii]|uniref:13372_t:CDS:1 n=1 Tax=Ambispora gerdemannii TaxID=144530 RepID=A0A9N8VMK4_9GLOM|nr:13372_t:CDS:2 [Ambispora gerdemannii]